VDTVPFAPLTDVGTLPFALLTDVGTVPFAPLTDPFGLERQNAFRWTRLRGATVRGMTTTAFELRNGLEDDWSFE